MTTVDAPTSPIPEHWVERAEARANASTVDARRVLLAVLFFIPMAVGVVIALVVRACVFTYAAGREGYAIGRAANLSPSPKAPSKARVEDPAESARWEAGKRVTV